jgi:hypothetical protein
MKNAARIKEQSSTAGLASYELASSGALYRRFRDEFATSERVRYFAASNGDYEEVIGVLTYGTPDTLSRDTILRSSQSGAKINWPAGTRDLFVDPLPGTVPVQTKGGNYTATFADHGSLLLFSGTTTPTLSLPAAATVCDGFSFEVKNDGTGDLTIDPASTELINGAATAVLKAGSSGFVRCSGTAWFAVGFAVLDVDGLTLEDTIDAAADTFPFFDDSAGENRKGTFDEIPGIVRFGTGYTRDPIALDWDSGNVAHGLGGYPDGFRAFLECKTAELGYSVGDRVYMNVAHYVAGVTLSLATIADGTNIRVRYGNNTLPSIPNKTTTGGGATSITAANWKLVVTPFRIQT